jgi:hypothetical protein
MNHQKVYEAIIDKARFKNRKKLRKTDFRYNYYENHHIIPRCLNGNNENENKVLLTAREHFVCHKLLTYIYPGNYKIMHAFHLMTFMNKRKYGITSRDYAYAIQLFRQIPVDHRGEKNSMFGKTTVLLSDGTSKSVSIIDPLYLDGTYKSHHAGENNGMYGTNNYKLWVEKYGIKEANKRMNLYRKRLSESLKNSQKLNNSGEHNPMYDRKIYDIWVEKYGIEEADKRKLQWKKNLSGKKLYHNDNLNKRKYLKPEEVEYYINNGWMKGQGKLIKNI